MVSVFSTFFTTKHVSGTYIHFYPLVWQIMFLEYVPVFLPPCGMICMRGSLVIDFRILIMSIPVLKIILSYYLVTPVI